MSTFSKVCFREELSSGKHEHSSFSTYTYFLACYEEISPVKRHYHELIEGLQKPHFDVDIPITANCQEVMKEFLERLTFSLDRRGIPHQDKILVFTSSDPTKESFHVVVDGYYHLNNVEARSFYREVTQGMVYGPYIDDIYQKVHYLRLMGSTKLNDHRVKRGTCSLDRSLVTYLEDCIPFPPPKEPLPSPETFEETLGQFLSLLSRKERIQGVSGRYVRVSLKDPCPICQEKHDGFLVLEEGRLRRHCQKDLSKSVLL